MSNKRIIKASRLASFRSRGLTLTEILIAVSILGLGLVLAIAVFPAALLQHQYAVEHVEGVTAAIGADELIDMADLFDLTAEGGSPVFGDVTAPAPFPGDLVVEDPLNLGNRLPLEGVWYAMPAAFRIRESCTNLIDDDGDGQVDGLDSDCSFVIENYLGAKRPDNTDPVSALEATRVNRDANFIPRNVYRDLDPLGTPLVWEFNRLPWVIEDLSNAYFGRQDTPRYFVWPFFRDTNDPALPDPEFKFRMAVLRFDESQSFVAIGQYDPFPGDDDADDNGLLDHGIFEPQLVVRTDAAGDALLLSHPVPWRVRLVPVDPGDASIVRLAHGDGEIYVTLGPPLANPILGDLLQEKLVFFGAVSGRYYRVVTSQSRPGFPNQAEIQPPLAEEDYQDPNDPSLLGGGVWLFPPTVEGSGLNIAFTTVFPYATGL